MRWPRRAGSVAGQILLLQLLLVVLLVVVALALAAYDARRDARSRASEQTLAVAEAVADSPAVRDAFDGPAPTTVLQPYAEEVRRDTGTDFVVVMDRDRIRFTHPEPDRIGAEFVGDLGTAPDGTPFTQDYVGTLGPSVRTVVPVLAESGEVIGFVAVGISLEQIRHELVRSLTPLALAGLVELAVGGLGTLLLSRRLRRQTHGMGAAELTRMYEYYDAVLHAVREGLLLLDTDNRVQLANDEARRLLDLPPDAIGRRLADLGLPPALVRAAIGDRAEADDIYVTDRHVLVVSSSPALWQGRVVGAVVTLRDRTELQEVAGELDLVRGLTDSLRAQTHEAANRLHTVVSLIEMGQPEEAVEFATEELQVAQLLADRLTAAVEEPVLAALLLGKTAEAAERGVLLEVEGRVVAASLPLDARELLTVVGNLVDNALEAVTAQEPGLPRRIRVTLDGAAGHLVVTVDDSGPGVAAADVDHVMERGWSTKAAAGHGVGLALVGQVIRRHGGLITVEDSPLGGARFGVRIGGDA
jgi:sensor histidine kinase regulating citrate/malate metabolism